MQTFLARHSCGRPISKQIGEAIPELLNHVRLDLRGLYLPHSLDSSFSIRKIEHQHVVQLFESDGIGCSAHRSVILQRALDDAVIEDSYLTKQAQPGNLAVDLFDVLHPPGDLQIILFLSHGFAPSPESS